jgi:hypothetical protein
LKRPVEVLSCQEALCPAGYRIFLPFLF